jgi:hypothetical protein
VVKASLGGGKQTKMYSGKTGLLETDQYIWEELLKAEQDLDPTRAKQKRAVWETLMAVMPYLTEMKWSDPQRTNKQAAIDFQKKFAAFMKAYNAQWGSAAAIHYFHHCWVHMPKQIEMYGPPFLWSSSSMEKSHWKAHGNFHKHTQQGGHVGKNKQFMDPLRQLMQFEVRQILHRFRLKLMAAFRKRYANNIVGCL